MINSIFLYYLRHRTYSEVIHVNSEMAMQCNLWDAVQNSIWWLGESYEIGAARFMRRTLRPGMIVIDVGANVGFYSLLSSVLVGGQGRVYAFEPVAQQYDALVCNVGLNKMRNVVAERRIVSDAPGQMPIRLGPRYNTGMASVSARNDAGEQVEVVECITLDAFLEAQKPPRVDLIKVDVEGHELAVLRGGLRSLATFEPVLLVEVQGHLLKRAGSSANEAQPLSVRAYAEEVYQTLGHMGYRPYSLLRDGRAAPLEGPQDGNLVIFTRDPGRL